LIAITLFPRILRGLRHGIHDGAKLFGAVSSEAEILDIDLRRFNGGAFQRVLFELTTEGKETLTGSGTDIGVWCSGKNLIEGATSSE
jgi:hypothetical protein